MSLIIFDWDDTLFPTTWITGKNNKSVEELRDYEDRIVKVLQIILKLGSLYIVSNSNEGWVKNSGENVLPRVWNMISDKPIIASKSVYERAYPMDPVKWKVCAFQDIVQNKGYYQLISIGDSQCERIATGVVGKLEGVRHKSVKLAEKPTIQLLKLEWDLVLQILEYIFKSKENLDLFVKAEVPCRSVALPLRGSHLGSV